MYSIASFTKKITKVAFNICLLGVVFVLIAPLAYFAWRANQPMDMTQFGGLSYYQLLNERRQDYINLSEKYQTSHPDQVVNYLNCFLPEISLQILSALPNAGFYAVAGMFPDLKKYVNLRDLRNGLVPEQVTWFTLLPAWWETYEEFVWGMAEHTPHGPVIYCRIPPNYS